MCTLLQTISLGMRPTRVKGHPNDHTPSILEYEKFIPFVKDPPIEEEDKKAAKKKGEKGKGKKEE